MTIQILPARLANQIAAGEVVERPASVIKELIENSLDSGATVIDIDVQKGGSKLIRIRDNGSGIPKDELGLALSRHATSKVCSFDDLENITSLGFRGEALASISSVSRLKLTSKPADQSEAWQAYAEGRDMTVKIIPAAHPDGSTIEVTDLFFNTPARRKFLRTEKTEFYHIDEVIKRIALSRFDVQFSLTHNGKSVRHLRKAVSDIEQQRRIAQVCGKSSVDTMVQLNCEQGEVILSGWVSLPSGCRQQNDMQYSYVNGRMMRDKLINHAIRQAYGDSLGDQQYPTYVLFVALNPRHIDVNVHPAKHEVRFHEARFIHDFIVQALEKALDSQYEQPIEPAMVEPLPQSTALYPGQAYPTATAEPCQVREPQGVYQVSQSSNDNHRTQPQDDFQLRGGYQPNHQPSPSPGLKQQSAFQGNQQGHHQANKPSPKELHSYHQALASFAAPLPETQRPELIPTVAKNNDSGDCLAVVSGHYALFRSYSGEGSGKGSGKSAGHDLRKNDRDNPQSNWQSDGAIDDTEALAHSGLYLLDLNKVNAMGASVQYDQGLIGQPLLLPVKMAQDKSTLALIIDNTAVFNRLGVEFQCLDRHVVIRKVPALIRNRDISQIMATLFEQLSMVTTSEQPSEKDVWQHCIQWLVQFYGAPDDNELDLATATRWIRQALQVVDQASLLARCGVAVDLSMYIDQLVDPKCF
ncbi:MAG: DNA mismatch repair protein MutL [Phenylobacterium sp.]|jgi:DNA mismatch repair protein MutL